jgi:GTP 3',8-cyclase
MIDGCGREIDHLRLSLTDHCNLACRYCVSEGAGPSRQMIDASFAYELVRWLSEHHGLRHVRLTGGEPLLYPELISLVQRLSSLAHLSEITLTTNGQALTRNAAPLRKTVLSRINVSLDTLNPERFAQVTRGGRVEHTFDGIEAAINAGLTPVKLNMVVQRGLNDDEIVDAARWGLELGCVVRFLEVMPIGPLAHVIDEHLVPASEIFDKLSAAFRLAPIPQGLGQPAVDHAATAGLLRGVIGIIAPTTRPFCDRCRRIRITSHGAVVACVHDNRRLDTSKCWNGRRLDEERANEILKQVIMENLLRAHVLSHSRWSRSGVELSDGPGDTLAVLPRATCGPRGVASENVI